MNIFAHIKLLKLSSFVLQPKWNIHLCELFWQQNFSNKFDNLKTTFKERWPSRQYWNIIFYCSLFQLTCPLFLDYNVQLTAKGRQWGPLLTFAFEKAPRPLDRFTDTHLFRTNDSLLFFFSFTLHWLLPPAFFYRSRD